jgi:4-alpha-glucanotransferase
MLSRARLAIASVPDLLALDSRARINTPGRMEGNWRWRITPAQVAALPRRNLRALTEAVGRLDAVLG